MKSIAFTEDQEKVFTDAIEAYGTESQLDQLQEECIELALAIRKYKRAIKEGVISKMKERRAELASEIADVIIMTNQALLMPLFSSEEIQQEVNFKIRRQRNRIDLKMKSQQTVGFSKIA